MLFEKVLEMSLLGCYVIAVVLVIRLLLNKCERKYSFVLWFVVFINLILPVSIQGPFSLIPERIAENTVVQDTWEDVQARQSEQMTVPKQNVENAQNTVADSTIMNGTTNAMADGTMGNSVVNGTATGSTAVNNTVGNQTAANSATGSNPIENDTSDKVQADWDYVGSFNSNSQEAQKPSQVGSEMVPNPSQAGSEVVIAPAEGTSQTQPQMPVVSTQPAPAVAVGKANITWQTIAGWIWLTVLALIWCISLYKGLSLSRTLNKCREEQELTKEGVVCAESISAPFLWGVLKPVIYLPASIEEEERTYIVAHESYHKKRFDHITKLVVFVIVTIHWFNPLVWLAYALFVRDMEISCDEAVLAHTGRDIKKQYASSLLKYAARQNGFVLAPLTFGEPSLKSRIKNVLHYKKKGLVVTIAAVCVVALTACGLIMRPEGEKQSGNDVVQGSNGQNATAPVEPTEQPEATKEPEATKAPEAVQTPGDFAGSTYSVYFQDILQANYEEEAGKYHTIEDVKESVKYSYVESVADYREPEAAYSAKSDLSLENGGICRIDWIKLSSDLNLENLTFDMNRELEEANLEDGFVHGVFYDREEDWVYVIISNHTGTPSTTWMICFRPENPTDYEIYDYEYSSWFGECYYVDGTIYLHSGSVDTPYVIDVETKEGRLCTAEYTAARAATYELSAEYAETHESALYVYWMKGFAKWEDVDIFSGLLMEAMDFFPGVADIYVASRDGKILETMIVDIETGEVTIVEGLDTNPAVKPLTQEDIDWFNESFFNQGYLREDATVYESIRNQFLTCEYAKPEDINISEVFYNGAGEEMTEDDKLCLSGEARWELPLYTGDMNLLSEEEHAAVAEIDVDVSRTSWDTMDSIMEMYTGLGIWDTNRCGIDQFYFNKRDMVYYLIHGDTNALFMQVRRGHYNADGTITLYYVRGGSQNWIDEATEEFAVVLEPTSVGYWFVSNRRVEGSRLSSEQEAEQIDLSGYPEYFAEILQECMETGNYQVGMGNVENLWLTEQFEDSGKVTEEKEYQYQVTHLQLADGTKLENLSFDLKDAMLEGEMTNVDCVGVFPKVEQDMVYLLLAEGVEREDWYKGGVLVVAFSAKEPENYEIHTYPGVLGWFGDNAMLENDIYVYIDSAKAPFEINVETWEGRYCESQMQKMEALAADFAESCMELYGKEYRVYYFGGNSRIGDVELYSGSVREAMDTRTLAYIYTAYRNDTYLGALMIDVRTGAIYYSAGQQEEAPAYKLTTADHEDYNAIFENNGYQYRFKLDMDTTNLFLRLGEEIERSNSTGKWTVTPVYASNGAQEEQLGELRGFTFDITSDALVEPKYAPGELFYGTIGEVAEGNITIQPVEAIDRDTYIEYKKNVMEEPVTYKLSESVEYIMLDANFRGVNADYERFLEHMSGTADKVCCFVVEDGVILQIREPYIP